MKKSLIICVVAAITASLAFTGCNSSNKPAEPPRHHPQQYRYAPQPPHNKNFRHESKEKRHDNRNHEMPSQHK